MTKEASQLKGSHNAALDHLNYRIYLYCISVNISDTKLKFKARKSLPNSNKAISLLFKLCFFFPQNKTKIPVFTICRSLWRIKIICENAKLAKLNGNFHEMRSFMTVSEPEGLPTDLLMLFICHYLVYWINIRHSLHSCTRILHPSFWNRTSWTSDGMTTFLLCRILKHLDYLYWHGFTTWNM